MARKSSPPKLGLQFPPSMHVAPRGQQCSSSWQQTASSMGQQPKPPPGSGQHVSPSKQRAPLLHVTVENPLCTHSASKADNRVRGTRMMPLGGL